MLNHLASAALNAALSFFISANDSMLAFTKRAAVSRFAASQLFSAMMLEPPTGNLYGVRSISSLRFISGAIATVMALAKNPSVRPSLSGLSEFVLPTSVTSLVRVPAHVLGELQRGHMRDGARHRVAEALALQVFDPADGLRGDDRVADDAFGRQQRNAMDAVRIVGGAVHHRAHAADARSARCRCRP